MKVIIRVLSVFIFVVTFSLTISCGSHVAREQMNAFEAFRQAMDEFHRGKYLNAVDQLTLVTFNYSGSSIVDSAQYYLAESHFMMKEYILAAAEFERLVSHFPSSPLVDDARYKIGLCYFKLSPKYALDQEYTYKAIEEYQRFTEDYPQSSLVPEVLESIFQARTKLAKKTFKSGKLYFRMKDYQSAIIYMNEVLDYYYDTNFAPPAMLLKGESLSKLEREDEARQVFDKLVNKYPDSNEAEIAAIYLNAHTESQPEYEK